VRFEAQAAPSGVKALLVASPPERFGDLTFSMAQNSKRDFTNFGAIRVTRVAFS
jgi:hypothetical protein